MCFCTNPMFGEFFVPEMLAKMLSTNHIAGFFNHPYLRKKSMKEPDFLHVDANLHTLKLDHDQNFWVSMVKKGCGQSGHRTLKLTVS